MEVIWFETRASLAKMNSRDCSVLVDSGRE